MALGYSISAEIVLPFCRNNIVYILRKFQLKGITFHPYLNDFIIDRPVLDLNNATNIFFEGLPEDPDIHFILAKKDDVFFKLFIASEKDNTIGILVSWFSEQWWRNYPYSNIEQMDLPKYLYLFISALDDFPIRLVAIEHDKFMYETYEKEPMVYAYICMELKGKWIGKNLKAIISNADKSGIALYEDSSFSKRFTFSPLEENTEFVLYAETAGYCLQVKLFHNAIEFFPLSPIRFKKDVCTEVEVPDIVFYTYIMLSLCDGFLIRSLKTENFAQLFEASHQ